MSDADGSAWPEIVRQIHEASVDVEAIPVDPVRGQAVLKELQLTERSTLGAIAANAGGLLIESGWLRILGGGMPGLPSLSQENSGSRARSHLVVAFDALGGRFAIDGGGLGIAAGEVCYWGPDTLAWSGIGGGLSAFVSWALDGGLTDFYASLRWTGWRQDSSSLAVDQGWSLYPPPFSTEGQNANAVSRSAVPLAELHYFYAEAARQLNGGNV
ncbi:DUF2625 family protein [Leifsonia sp. NPDC056665]|uniref:DUF2625 family protein n=1 Tax=Leifsonia sp. NPDC056665 TaxID=3345901 RepID=UPI0036820AAD